MICVLSHMRAKKALAKLRNRAVSSEPSMLEHTQDEARSRTMPITDIYTRNIATLGFF